ncbi:helix-turn-helix transcriptional regulator [Haloarcula amylovorans]|uniref:helix-turn-helix transcriptional regulator n=1 Tax=Haloarcula amylovorans TaxID=2562280 RepID=UPI001075F812|nr:helix-turn-helix domain-containing protein [Halomicroarcula amylolytica]
MSRAVAAVVVALLLIPSLAAGPALSAPEPASVQTPDGFTETTFHVTVYENGSATWAIEHQTPLTNESEQEQFEAFAEEFESNETELYVDFVEQAGLLTQYGTNQTGRAMGARTFDRSASVNPVQSTGTVRMSFLWTNFANATGERVVVSDVFQGGFYIGQNQSLVVERGPGLGFAEAQPSPDSRSQPDSLARSETATWVGEQSFTDQRPYIELGPREVVLANEPGSGGGSLLAGDMLPFVVGVVVLALGAVAVAAWRSGVAEAALGGADTGGTPTETTPSGQSRAPSQPEPEPSVADDELLTDDDRVLKLLEANGGRMKQVDIVDATDWSKSKVSMLLSEMESDGEISKLRVGRENIISLAGEEPDAAGSPFEEE